MSIELGRFGVWRRVADIDPSMAREVEDLGYGAIWVGGSPSGDLERVEEIIAATERIPVVTGIVNMWREEAATVARSYQRVDARHPGRFLLGVGVGHPEATDEYRGPLEKIMSYLAELEDAGVPHEALVLAALGPRVLEIAAERTVGAHPYLTTPRHTRFAREVMGPGPLLAPEQKVILEEDGDRARTLGRKSVARYLRLVNYRNSLLREGWEEPDLDDGGSDALVDELVLHGGPEDVAAGIRAHLDAGADHVCIQAIGDNPLGEYREIGRVLLGER